MAGKKQYYVTPIMLARQRKGMYECAQDPRVDADIRALYRKTIEELSIIFDEEVG